MGYESQSFYISTDNKKFIKARVLAAKESGRKKFNASVWLDDLLDALRAKGAPNKAVAVKTKAPTSPRKVKSYPSNLDDQFLMLWDTKGKRGAKQKAYDKYKSLMCGHDDSVCESATKIMVDDIIKNKGECGYPELHLITYLNQERWEK